MTISWTIAAESSAVTELTLAAGTGSGLGNAAVIGIASSTSPIVVSGVPPGRCFVRLHATNVPGRSTSSNELEIVVPFRADAPLDSVNARVLAVTATRDAALVASWWLSYPGKVNNATSVVDLATLTTLQVLPTPVNEPSTTGAFTLDGGSAIVGSPASIRLFDIGTSTELLSTPADFGASSSVSVALASVPLPPTDLSADVRGHVVTVTWTLPDASPAATTFTLEAGSAAGLSNLAVVPIAGSVTSLTMPGVPPGRYFVRLYASNVTGRSGASSELEINVP